MINNAEDIVVFKRVFFFKFRHCFEARKEQVTLKEPLIKNNFKNKNT